ncbi:anti-repressor SinI family protein [Oceanobacillus halophilus]|uniref:DNA-binding anti-repressor SinI n=1 Tax=Oceanobacillus halophilus TaxID=930130 RepID=A0A495A287_9BACI|nr:anti-repressor SinI family protein [Oceanobacillus halophilus]RKQ33575.1 DNA-binding anti-repressor SinI [Oceanobacillus halophilus]
MVKEVNAELDQEWVKLILEAKKIGLSLEEVQAYLRKGGKKETEKEVPSIWS